MFEVVTKAKLRSVVCEIMQQDSSEEGGWAPNVKIDFIFPLVSLAG